MTDHSDKRTDGERDGLDTALDLCRRCRELKAISASLRTMDRETSSNKSTSLLDRAQRIREKIERDSLMINEYSGQHRSDEKIERCIRKARRDLRASGEHFKVATEIAAEIRDKTRERLSSLERGRKTLAGYQQTERMKHFA